MKTSAALLALVTCVSTAFAQTSLPLAGTWLFQLDRADAGIGERWFERTLPEKFTLPGSLPAAGIGDAPSLDTKWTGGVQAPK